MDKATRTAQNFADDTAVWQWMLQHIPSKAQRGIINIVTAGAADRVAEAFTLTNPKNIIVNEPTEKYKSDATSNHSFDVVAMNPPFYNGAKNLFDAFLHKCYDLMRNDSYGAFILPSSAITTGHRDSRVLTSLFDIRVINLHTNNAGFDDVHRNCVGVIVRKLNTDNFTHSARLYVDDQYINDVDQYNFVAFKNKFYGRRGALASVQYETALNILNKVHSPENDSLMLNRKSTEPHAIINQYACRQSAYRKIGVESLEKGIGIGINFPTHGRKMKCTDASHLIWYVRNTTLFLFLNDAMSSHLHGKTLQLQRCISKDYEMLRSNEDIYKYYEFSGEEIAFLESYAHLKLYCDT